MLQVAFDVDLYLGCSCTDVIIHEPKPGYGVPLKSEETHVLHCSRVLCIMCSCRSSLALLRLSIAEGCHATNVQHSWRHVTYLPVI